MTAEPAPRGNHLAAVPETEDQRRRQLAELAAAALHHKDQAIRHLAASKAAESALMKLHGHQGSTIDVGDLKVTWKNPGRSFDKEAFVKAYPREANAYLYKELDPVLDTEAIPPKLKKDFMRPGQGEGTIVIT